LFSEIAEELGSTDTRHVNLRETAGRSTDGAGRCRSRAGICPDIDPARTRSRCRVAALSGPAARRSEPPRARAGRVGASCRTHAAAVEREYFDLFVGRGRGELSPYASFYLTGFLHGHTMARLRHDLAKLGLRRSPDIGEPEDHAAILCAVMSGLVRRHSPAPPEAERALFEVHLVPWIGHLFADL
jgi:TorA maturation chaperone TorD